MRTLGLACLLSCCFSLHAEKIIQCITNFPVDVQVYNDYLHAQGYEGKVILTDFKEYASSLKWRKGFFHSVLRSLNCDYPWSVPVAAEVDKIVFFNLTPAMCRRCDLSRLPKEKLILFMWEPRTVLRRMYRPQMHEWFSKVYTWDDDLVDNYKYFKFNYPALVTPIETPVPFSEKKLCTQVSSNIQGTGHNELYSARKEVIAYFENAHEEGFEFYGRKWDPQQYKSYKGAPDDKLQVMKNYRFCMCYENTQRVKGYITEKIFDCFAARTVPIYWGASNIDEYIPRSCFIDRRDFSDLESLHAFIKSMDEQTYQGYLDAIDAFFVSKDAHQFTYEELTSCFYKAITE